VAIVEAMARLKEIESWRRDETVSGGYNYCSSFRKPHMSDAQHTNVFRRAILSLCGFLALLAVAMFLPAGIEWWKGWLFLAVFLLQMAIAAVYIWRTNPDLFIARSRMQKGTKAWDRVLFYVLQFLLLAEFPVAVFDWRNQWSSAPVWIIIIGYVLLTAGMVGCFWVLSVNKFAEMSVRIQTERGHKVIDTGPYAVVRHPMYVACFLLFPGIALALGSYWALIPAALVCVVLVVRTVLEDRTLQKELEGYKEYAERVRYRLIPGVW
jgi:protein-S-isoprenylcysteine O-methyltransferase Ste14